MLQALNLNRGLFYTLVFMMSNAYLLILRCSQRPPLPDNYVVKSTTEHLAFSFRFLRLFQFLGHVIIHVYDGWIAAQSFPGIIGWLCRSAH